MSVDERLRDSLRLTSDHLSADVTDELARVVATAERRRRRPRVALAVAASVASAALAVAVPWAIAAHNRDDTRPTEHPTSSLPSHGLGSWKPAPPTPIDHVDWQGRVLPRSERTAPLRGTDLDRFADGVFDRAFFHRSADIELRLGVCRLHLDDFFTHHPSIGYVGDYVVHGQRVVLTFDGLPGATVFDWTLQQDRYGPVLRLDFVSTTVDTLYGAPAEVFFREWSAARFV